MHENFILSCESTADLPYAYMQGRNISVLFYSYTINGEEFVDDMLRSPEALPQFYQLIANGKLPSTSQINTYRYLEYFEPLLEQGDVLHIAFGSGMTPSVHNARAAAEQLREKYPHRKLCVVDSTCSAAGYGLLIDMAADLREAGQSIEQTEVWANANAKNVQHQFFSTDLTMFRRSGRVSGVAATAATILGICPLMRLDNSGHIVAYSKVRGKKAAMQATVQAMVEKAQGGKAYKGKCFIGHSNCIDDANFMRDRIAETFPNVTDLRVYPIGTIIASHCGPGTVAVFFMGSERE